ncbi:MAG TPA: hypothetical protein VHV77_10465 [Pirellulales bacterium]|nr:hypothetical protein [Pirellulales bacterium]
MRRNRLVALIAGTVVAGILVAAFSWHGQAAPIEKGYADLPAVNVSATSRLQLTGRQITDQQITVKQPPAQEEASFPIILRIDRAALLQLTSTTVDKRDPVNNVVFGTHAVGETHVMGTTSSELIPDSTEALLTFHFQGTSVSKTVGVNDRATICSRTFTDFDCARQVAFDPRQGFVPVGKVSVTTNTRLVYDSFGSTQNFGRRIVAAVAKRRAYEQHERFRNHADHDNRHGLEEGFAKQTLKQLAAANDQTDFVRYVSHFLGSTTPLQISAKSSTDCVHIGVGLASERYAAMTDLPRLREKSAPFEIWVNMSFLGAPIVTLLPLGAPTGLLTTALEQKILEVLSIPAPDESMHLGFEAGWLVFELPVRSADTSSTSGQ